MHEGVPRGANGEMLCTSSRLGVQEIMRTIVTAKGDDDGPAPRCEAPDAVTGKARLRERVVAPVFFEDRLLRAQ